MRLAASLVPLCLLGTACRDSATEPSRVVTSGAPSGIPVAAAVSSTRSDANPFDASVTAAGDSVVLTYVYGGSGCGLDYTASAGVVDGALVVTHVGHFPDPLPACIAYAPRLGPTFRFVVRPPRSGRLEVLFRQRTQRRAGAPEFFERDLARRTVTLP